MKASILSSPRAETNRTDESAFSTRRTGEHPAATRERIASCSSLIARRVSTDVLDYIDRTMRSMLTALSDEHSGELLEILDDIAGAVREGLT